MPVVERPKAGVLVLLRSTIWTWCLPDDLCDTLWRNRLFLSRHDFLIPNLSEMCLWLPPSFSMECSQICPSMGVKPKDMHVT